MRIQIEKNTETKWVKEKDLQRFLDKGWQKMGDQPNPKKLDYKLEVQAEVVADEDDDPDFEAPLFSLPTEDKGDE